jgi:hypothetical protein
VRLADLGYPTLNTIDSEVTQESVRFILTYTKHAEEGEGGLDELDEFENGGAKKVGGTYHIVHAVHGDESVFSGIPVRKVSSSPQVNRAQRYCACLGSSRVKAILPLQPIRSILIFVYN